MVRSKNIYHVYFDAPNGGKADELSDGYLTQCGIPLLDFSCGDNWRYSDYYSTPIIYRQNIIVIEFYLTWKKT